jgi:hypothetical protein
MVRELFDVELTDTQIKGTIARYKLNTGRTGRFDKGHVPQNKGRKGWCPEGSKPTQFKPGIVPANRVPLGTEKQRADGYVWVKVQDGHKNANWRGKHVLAWEAANGSVPPGHVVMLIDGDATNCALDNLLLVTRNDICRFNHMGFEQGPDGITESGILVARLHNTIADRRRGAHGSAA